MKRIFSLLTFLFLQNISSAQETGTVLGINANLGITNYYGDLDDDETYRFKNITAGIDGNLHLSKRLALNAGLKYAKIEARDAEGEMNKGRGLSFFTDIFEANTTLQFKFLNERKSFMRRNIVVPYLFAGIGYFHFNPKAIYNGAEYELQKIGTEGQHLSRGNYPVPYKLFQWCVPMGFGFKFKITKAIDAGIEAGYRKLFTDYLDDVSTVYPEKSQLLKEEGAVALALSDRTVSEKNPNDRPSFASRGNPGNNDAYTFTTFQVTYYFLPPSTKIHKVKR